MRNCKFISWKIMIVLAVLIVCTLNVSIFIHVKLHINPFLHHNDGDDVAELHMDGLKENLRRQKIVIKGNSQELYKKPPCATMKRNLIGKLSIKLVPQATIQEALSVSGDNLINGCYVPPLCEPQQKIAIIIPYRKRYRSLVILAHHLHPILQRQNAIYCVFVAEQYDNGVFNKGRLLNSAFDEISRNFLRYGHPLEAAGKKKEKRPFDCFIFHDVDMLVEDDRTIYRCKDMPYHLSPVIDMDSTKYRNVTRLKGVMAMRTEVYRQVNGFSNRFTGWDADDDQLAKRIKENGLVVEAAKQDPNEGIQTDAGKYKMLSHKRPWWFYQGIDDEWLWTQAKSDSPRDFYERDPTGLSDTVYWVQKKTFHVLWTRITIDIRDVVFEQARTRFLNYKTEDVTVKFTSDADDDDDFCDPTYQRFWRMTIAPVHSHQVTNESARYRKRYRSLDEAKWICDLMDEECQGIVEDERRRFTLRATGLVQANNLTYLSLMNNASEPRLVKEIYNSRAAYVKICSGDPRYLQYFRQPIRITGKMYTGEEPRFTTEFKWREDERETRGRFTYRTRTISTHRALMEAKLARGVVRDVSWESVGNPEYSIQELIGTTPPAVAGANATAVTQHLATTLTQQDFLVAPTTAHRRRSASVNFGHDYPGCYVTNHVIVRDDGDVALVWNTWMQVRGDSPEVEDQVLKWRLERQI